MLYEIFIEHFFLSFEVGTDSILLLLAIINWKLRKYEIIFPTGYKAYLKTNSKFVFIHYYKLLFKPISKNTIILYFSQSYFIRIHQ